MPTTIQIASCSTDRITCPCGQTFIPDKPGQKYCSRTCQKNGKRSATRGAHDVQFVGVDGEGVNLTTGEHRYVMLSVGDKTLWNGGKELTHRDIFPFLWEQYEANPRACFVGFFLGYDFTLWLKSLPEQSAYMLFQGADLRKRSSSGKNPTPFPVYVDGWELDMLGMRRMKLRPHVCKPGRNGICACGSDVFTDEKPHPWLYICDTGSYFQTSFLRVIDPDAWDDDPPCSAEEYATIKRGKSARADVYEPGDTSYLPDMKFYNQLENRILGRVMATLNKGFVSAGVKLSRSSYYGPGQAIQAWLTEKSKHVPCLTHDDIDAVIPPEVIHAWQRTYYGGRFEIFYHGIIEGTSHEYDIQSAYPHAMRNLPCLCSARYVAFGRNGLPDKCISGLTIAKATVYATNPYVGPLPHRLESGNIIFPEVTTGWYRLSELDAAIKAGLVKHYDILGGFACISTCDHEPPLKEIADLFLTRLRVGKKTAYGKALKLMLNSGYGKFAQSVGSPKFANPIYASMITSECRIMILNAIGTHPHGIDDVVMIATDGIYFKSPHPTLCPEDREELGYWEHAEKPRLTLMKPGVYWDDKNREKHKRGEYPGLKSRGIAPGALAAHMLEIDEQFKRLIQHPDKPPAFNMDIPFTITSPTLALARHKWHTCGQVEYSRTVTQSARIEPKRRNPHRFHGLIRSKAAVAIGESAPYKRQFGFENAGQDDLGFSPDGTAIDVWLDNVRDLML